MAVSLRGKFFSVNLCSSAKSADSLDPSQTDYVSPLLQFSEAKELHIQPAELATMAFLERNPKDFDNADLLKLMFLKPALAKAQG
jgi:hypothetical protein